MTSQVMTSSHQSYCKNYNTPNRHANFEIFNTTDLVATWEGKFVQFFRTQTTTVGNTNPTQHRVNAFIYFFAKFTNFYRFQLMNNKNNKKSDLYTTSIFMTNCMIFQQNCAFLAKNMRCQINAQEILFLI